MFIGWFLTFAFSDYFFVKFNLFDQTTHDSYKIYNNEDAFQGASEGAFGIKASIATTTKQNETNTSASRTSLLSRPENFS